MKNNKLSHLLTIIFIAISFNVTGQDTIHLPKLSGYWEINLQKSEFGKLDPAQAVAATIFLKQSSGNILMQRFYNAKPIVLDTLSISGRPFIATDEVGGFTRTCILSISKSSRGINVLTHYKDNGRGKIKNFNRTESYSVSQNGKELTLLRTFVLPEGDFTVKAVYNLVMTTTDRLTTQIQPTANFSGVWRLVPELSNYAVFDVNHLAKRLVIIQMQDTISIEKRFADDSRETSVLNVNGSRINIENVTGQKSSYVKFALDPPTMMVYTDGVDEKKTVQQELFELSSVKKILILHKLNISPISFTLRLVYEKID